MTVDAEVLEGQRVQVGAPGRLCPLVCNVENYVRIHIAVFTRQLKLTLVV